MKASSTTATGRKNGEILPGIRGVDVGFVESRLMTIDLSGPSWSLELVPWCRCGARSEGLSGRAAESRPGTSGLDHKGPSFRPRPRSQECRDRVDLPGRGRPEAT